MTKREMKNAVPDRSLREVKTSGVFVELSG